MTPFWNFFKLAKLMAPSSPPVSNTLNCHRDFWYRIILSSREENSYLLHFSSLVFHICRWWKEVQFCQQLLPKFTRAWQLSTPWALGYLRCCEHNQTHSSSFLVWNCTGAMWITEIWHLKDFTILWILPWQFFMDKFTL